MGKTRRSSLTRRNSRIGILGSQLAGAQRFLACRVTELDRRLRAAHMLAPPAPRLRARPALLAHDAASRPWPLPRPPSGGSLLRACRWKPDLEVVRPKNCSRSVRRIADASPPRSRSSSRRAATAQTCNLPRQKVVCTARRSGRGQELPGGNTTRTIPSRGLPLGCGRELQVPPTLLPSPVFGPRPRRLAVTTWHEHSRRKRRRGLFHSADYRPVCGGKS